MILGRKYVSDNKGARMAVARHDAPRSCCGNLHRRLRDLERMTGHPEVGRNPPWWNVNFLLADNTPVTPFSFPNPFSEPRSSRAVRRLEIGRLDR